MMKNKLYRFCGPFNYFKKYEIVEKHNSISLHYQEINGYCKVYNDDLLIYCKKHNENYMWFLHIKNQTYILVACDKVKEI